MYSCILALYTIVYTKIFPKIVVGINTFLNDREGWAIISIKDTDETFYIICHNLKRYKSIIMNIV